MSEQRLLRARRAALRDQRAFVASPSSKRLGARADRRQRIVDLVHDAGGERADRGELLGLREALLGAPASR